ncbi:MAG: helix-turn-helix domain-containing protein [Cyanobacteriota bacterium]|nr:helix-turn-helix domain-containing protein [Cyanobacteriota bacterium]
MHREEIKAQLRLKGSSLAGVSRELGVTKQTVNAVLAGKGRSKRIETAIAQKLGLSVEEVWPDRYPAAVEQFVLF